MATAAWTDIKSVFDAMAEGSIAKKDVTDAFYELAGRPPNGYGLINASLLEERLMNVGYEHEKLTKQQVEDILGMSEVDEKGDINYSEFVNLMMGENRAIERRLTQHPDRG